MHVSLVHGVLAMLRYLSGAGLALLLVGCAAATGQTQVLLYSDQSAGALLPSSAWRHALTGQGTTVVMKTDAAEFDAQIDQQQWQTVLVFARWTRDEPAYLAKLRAFSTAFPTASVEMFLWHDGGCTISPQVCVSASTAMTIWKHGFTSIKYTNSTDGSSGGANGMRTFDGRVWPTWEQITPSRPVGTILLPPEALEQRATFDLFQWFNARSECITNCYIRFDERVLECRDSRNQDESDCMRIHPPPNNDKLVECLKQAADIFKNCLDAAQFRLDNCIALCPDTPKPNEVPGGGVT